MGFDQDDGGDDSLEQNIKRVLMYQGVATVVFVLLIVISQSGLVSLLHDGSLPKVESLTGKLTAAFYGAALAIAGTIINARSVLRASKFATDLGSAAMTPIYSGLLNKLIIVGGGIAFGLIFLSLNPIYLIAGYLWAQLASVVTMIRS